MKYIVSTNTGKTLNFNETVIERTLTRVRNVISTIKGSLVLEREIGIPKDFIDSVSIKSLFEADIIEAIETYVSEVIVEDVEITREVDKVNIKVEVSLRDA